MLLLIDADQNHDTGWYGYDFLVNKRVTDAQSTTLYAIRCCRRRVRGLNRLRFPIATRTKCWNWRSRASCWGRRGMPFSFDFHWCDNPADLKDPISCASNGDSAPNRRFNYRCIWSK